MCAYYNILKLQMMLCQINEKEGDISDLAVYVWYCERSYREDWRDLWNGNEEQLEFGAVDIGTKRQNSHE